MKYIITSLFFLSLHLYSIAQTDSTAIDPLNILMPEWTYVAESSNYDTWFIKNGYEEKDGNKIKIWVKIIIQTFPYHGKVYKRLSLKVYINLNATIILMNLSTKFIIMLQVM